MRLSIQAMAIGGAFLLVGAGVAGAEAQQDPDVVVEERNEEGQLTLAVDEDGRVLELVYDEDGRLLYSVDESGEVTSYEDNREE